MAIHIKPSHKGKFTAYKKAHHVTTEEALHSKSPHVRQMANFARNAKKWHHKGDGGEINEVNNAAPKSNMKGFPIYDMTTYLVPMKASVLAEDGLTVQQRNNYEGAMGWLQTNKYDINNPKLRHDPSIGAGYIQDYNNAMAGTPDKQFDPRNIPAMQQYFQTNQGTDKVRTNDSRGFSPVDNFVGDQTLNSRQMTYQTVNGNTTTDFGTDQAAAYAMVDSWKKATPQQWQSNDKNIPMDSPVSSIAPANTDFKSPGKQAQASNWHTNEDTDYSIDKVRMAKKGGKITMKGKKMDDGGINLQLNSSQIMMGAIAGADMLATKFLYNPQIAAAEAKTRRNLITPTTAPNQFYGTGMGMYANGGRVDDKFETIPGQANTIVEGGEHMVLPNGVSSPIVGDAHSDPSGGEPRNYPEGTRIFSKKLKADKEFASAITGKKITKTMSIADLAKIFDTKKDADLLDDSDPVIARTRKMNFDLKNGKLDNIFDYQESMKDPGYMANKMFGGATLAANGTRVGPDEYFEPLQPLGPTLMPTPGPFLSGDKLSQTGLTMMPTPAPITQHTVQIGPNPDNDYTTPVSQVDTPQTPPLTGLPESKNNRFKFNTPKGVGDLLPEAFAAVNNMTNFPIYQGKLNPTYINPAETNIQASFNRNQAMASTNRASGNASIDNARGAAGQAALYNANNELSQSKFNADQQSKQYSDIYNANSKTRADQYNLSAMDAFWNKVTQRKTTQEATNQNIIESAYQKDKQRKLEDTSVGLYNQMFKDWEYDPVTKKYRPKQQNVARMPVMQTTV